MLLLLLVIGLASVPMWLLHRHQRMRSGGETPPAAVGFDAQLEVPPPSLGIMEALPVATPSAAPPICNRRSMPHEQRGTCRGCHLVTSCPPSSSAVAGSAIPTITRTSLLPHAFSGACGSCHVILATPIEPVNRDTLARFPVSDGDRALVMAGQQVVVPTPFHLLQAPLLDHDTVLPHAYVGVCSNCHRVIDLGQSPRTSADVLAPGRSRLLDLDLADRRIAHARPAPRSTGLLFLQYAFGALSLGLFSLGMVYVVLKLVILSKPRAEQGRYRKQYRLKRWFQVHVWSMTGFTVAIVAHWLCSTRGNFLLHLSLLLAIVLTVSGFLLRYRAHRLAFSKAGMRWLHTQRVFTCVLVVAAIVGHLLVQMR